MEEKRIRLTLRIPENLHQEIEQRCKKTRRSLNEEIITLLERFVDSEEISVPSDKKGDSEYAVGE